MHGSTFLRVALAVAALVVAALAAAIAFGGPGTPPPMASINNPFKTVDFSDLPPLQRYTADDGARLAYRHYASQAGEPKGSIVLVHGSSASSESMHPLAKAFARAGYEAYALDIRGHGASGVKGTIDYIGQLDDDLAAFMKTVTVSKPATLAGFSSGGGFVLRVAGSSRQDQFHSYLLLSPYIGFDAANARPDSGGWVDVGTPRVIGLTVLSRLGIRAFNGLTVVKFALDENVKTKLTPAYSFTLAANFQPQRDYKANIKAVRQPVSVVAGTEDESFRTDKLEGIFRAEGQAWPVRLVPGIGHIPLTTDPAAAKACVEAVDAMRKSAV
jgi:non-heme chloroperoxidase